MATLLKEPESRYDTGRTHAWEAKRSRRNVGGPERGARLAAGAVCAGGAPFVATTWLAVTLGIVGIDGLVTGMTGYSPFNRMIGRDSYHRTP